MHVAQACMLRKTIFKMSCEIIRATGKYLEGLMGPAISEGSFKSTHHLIRLAMESSKFFVLLL